MKFEWASEHSACGDNITGNSDISATSGADCGGDPPFDSACAGTGNSDISGSTSGADCGGDPPFDSACGDAGNSGISLPLAQSTPRPTATRHLLPPRPDILICRSAKGVTTTTFDPTDPTTTFSNERFETDFNRRFLPPIYNNLGSCCLTGLSRGCLAGLWCEVSDIFIGRTSAGSILRTPRHESPPLAQSTPRPTATRHLLPPRPLEPSARWQRKPRTGQPEPQPDQPPLTWRPSPPVLLKLAPWADQPHLTWLPQPQPTTATAPAVPSPFAP